MASLSLYSRYRLCVLWSLFGLSTNKVSMNPRRKKTTKTFTEYSEMTVICINVLPQKLTTKHVYSFWLFMCSAHGACKALAAHTPCFQ